MVICFELLTTFLIYHEFYGIMTSFQNVKKNFIAIFAINEIDFFLAII